MELLNYLIPFWVDNLGLQHWEIVVKVKRKFEMPEDLQGHIDYIPVNRQAVISILSLEDWTNEDFEQDIEKTLVHELLHLKFDSIAIEERDADRQHQLLNDMAKALVKARRNCIDYEMPNKDRSEI